MTVILGIDAAWTAEGSSGVALLTFENERSAVIATAASYRSFVDLANDVPAGAVRERGTEPCVPCLLAAARTLAGTSVDVVAVDMPMWTKRGPVNERRPADNAVSSTFGRQKAGVHSPTRARPGSVGERITQAFIDAGYRLATAQGDAATTPALIEVFPLAALVRLLCADERPKYKIGKIARHYPRKAFQTRQLQIAELLRTWKNIVAALAAEIDCIAFEIVQADFESTGWRLKSREDTLDAIVCAWVGLCFARRRAQAFGDSEKTAAIWIPTIEAGAGRFDPLGRVR